MRNSQRNSTCGLHATKKRRAVCIFQSNKAIQPARSQRFSSFFDAIFQKNLTHTLDRLYRDGQTFI